MRIFLTGTSFEQGYGGPAVSVSTLAIGLSEAGATVAVWSPDGSAVLNRALEANSHVIRYGQTARKALQDFGRPDVLHDNGIWMPHNHLLASIAFRRSIPRVVSPRGMLETWAINFKKWKKRSAWAIYQRRDLRRASFLHATSVAEAETLGRLSLPVPICVIPNGIQLPDLVRRSPHLGQGGGLRTVLFLGRFHPVKGLDLLIEAWARLRPRGWILRLAGPDEANYKKTIEGMVHAAGLKDVVEFAGPVSPEEKKAVFQSADLLVLPSYSENFGMVVAEALANGVPVVATKGSPWEVLGEAECGWWVDASVEGVFAGLKVATSLDRSELRRMGMRGRMLVENELSIGAISAKFIELYERAALNC